MADDDVLAVQEVLAGDRQAYGRLVRRHQARLRSLLSFYCRSAEEAEEFVQEAFVQAYVHLRKFDPAAPFYPWLKAIALNALRMEVRRKQVRNEGPAEYLRRLQMEAVELGEDVDARSEALQKCLESLPAPQAELLRARYREGRPIAQLTERFRTSVGALKLRLLRLREALKTCVDRRVAAEHRP